MRLADAAWLVLLMLAPLPWAWGRRRPRISWPSLGGFGAGRSGWAGVLRATTWATKGAAIACLAVAMARPQEPGGRVRVAGRGVAIVAVLDRSSSMKAVDFPAQGGPISRLEAAGATLARFVRARSDDLVGLIQFANYPDLVAAPTPDQSFLLDASDRSGLPGRWTTGRTSATPSPRDWRRSEARPRGEKSSSC